MVYWLVCFICLLLRKGKLLIFGPGRLMKIFLLIPAFLLFLSNIPFVHTMEMDEAEMVAVKKDGCCRKQDNRKPACKPEPVKASPKKHCGGEEKKECGKPANSACVCICCFQFAARDQVGARLQFGVSATSNSLTDYLVLHWKDPMLSLPWQPPDMVS
jgi:hypothetical protein